MAGIHTPSLSFAQACGEPLIEYCDNWFKGSSCGRATIRIFEFLLGSTSLFDGIDVIELSSDTGNGFLSIPVFRFYSTVWHRFSKAIRTSLYPPRHAGNPSDGHAARLSTAVDIIKQDGRITTLQEFADVSATLINTHSYTHDEGFLDDDADLDHAFHEDLPEADLAPSGIRNVGQAEFTWLLPDGTRFAQRDICRVQCNSGGNRWQIMDLNPDEKLPLCASCSNQAQKPLRHGADEDCPLAADTALHAPKSGIKAVVYRKAKTAAQKERDNEEKAKEAAVKAANKAEKAKDKAEKAKKTAEAKATKQSEKEKKGLQKGARMRHMFQDGQDGSKVQWFSGEVHEIDDDGVHVHYDGDDEDEFFVYDMPSVLDEARKGEFELLPKRSNSDR